MQRDVAACLAYPEYRPLLTLSLNSPMLQMVGRAGRPQYDTEGVAVIMTERQVGTQSGAACRALCRQAQNRTKPMFVPALTNLHWSEPLVAGSRTMKSCNLPFRPSERASLRAAGGRQRAGGVHAQAGKIRLISLQERSEKALRGGAGGLPSTGQDSPQTTDQTVGPALRRCCLRRCALRSRYVPSATCHRCGRTRKGGALGGWPGRRPAAWYD